MPAPSKLSITTSSLLRLLKEESSYHKELEQQQARVLHLEQGGESSDENADFKLRQERKAIEETKAVFAPLRQRILATATQLQQLVEGKESGSEAEIAKARNALNQAKDVQ